MTTGLLLATAVTTLLITEYNVSKNMSIVGGMLTWAMYGAIYYIYNMRCSSHNRQIYKLYARFLQKNKTTYYSFVAFERVYNWYYIYGISKTVSW